MDFYKPSIKRNDMQSVLMSMAEEQIGPGRKNDEFRELLKSFLNFKNILLLRSPISAFYTCLDSLDIQQNDKIIASCFMPLFYKILLENAGVEIEFCDVDKNTGLLDLTSIKDFENVKAVFERGFLGHVPDMSKYKAKGLKTLCDLTECIGLGMDISDIDIGILSLEYDKIITSAGGCALLSNVIKFDKPLTEDILGDLNISLCLQQLQNYSFYLKKRTEIKLAYEKSLDSSANKVFSMYSGEQSDNAFRFAILIENYKDSLNFLKKKDIPVKKAFEKTAYEELGNREQFKNASYLYPRVYCMPLYYYMTSEEFELVAKVLRVLP